MRKNTAALLFAMTLLGIFNPPAQAQSLDEKLRARVIQYLEFMDLENLPDCKIQYFIEDDKFRLVIKSKSGTSNRFWHFDKVKYGKLSNFSAFFDQSESNGAGNLKFYADKNAIRYMEAHEMGKTVRCYTPYGLKH